MSTNYFNPITYLPRQATQTPVQMPNATAFTLPANNFGVTGWSPTGTVAAPNQGQIATLAAGLYGTGRPGEAGYVPGLNERVGRMFGDARNTTRDALRGYGGVSFRNDDPSTPNVDESLMMDYQPDQLGSRERQAVLGARAQANARGMLSSGFADQQVGAALQRVGEEARQIVNQYSAQINQIANQYLDPLTGVGATTLQQIQSLYGADTQWAAGQEITRQNTEAAAAAANAAANAPAAPNPAVRQPGAVLWTGRNNPDNNAAYFNRQFGEGRWIVDVEWIQPGRGRGFNRYTVRAR